MVFKSTQSTLKIKYHHGEYPTQKVLEYPVQIKILENGV